MQNLLRQATNEIEDIALSISAQPLWCMGDETAEFKLSVGGAEFTAMEAGPPPFPLHRFEALQHSHLRQVIKFIELKLVQALNVTETQELALVLNNGVVRGAERLHTKVYRVDSHILTATHHRLTNWYQPTRVAVMSHPAINSPQQPWCSV